MKTSLALKRKIPGERIICGLNVKHLHVYIAFVALWLVPNIPLHATDSRKYIPEAGSRIEREKGLPWAFTPDPALPNVLILGDSVSIGYTLPVRRLLEGKANVFRPISPDGSHTVNCCGTTFGLQHINDWLAGHKWAVIYFNWGLHDLKHVNPESGKNSNNPNDPVQATVKQYSHNLKLIVRRLKATGARLIFATTTPVVPGTSNPYRSPDAPAHYNAAAVKIMKANGIRVDDLYAFCKPHLRQWQLPHNVHFNAIGWSRLAKHVAAVIEKELPQPHP